MQKHFEWQKYIIVFFITLGLFVAAMLLSNFFSDRRLEEIKSIQNTIAIDILSSETQFSLLSELSCRDVSNSNLSQELNSLAERIEYSERNLKGSDEVTELKKYYTLLQIKDYLLLKKINDRCGTDSVAILYFYTTAENCTECIRQSYVLTELREKYPNLRVYSFDYNLSLSAMEALVSIYKIQDTKLPALILDEKLVTGFKSTEDIEKLVPELPESLEIEKLETESKSTSSQTKSQN